MAGTVTLLFTDLVGSTELLGRLGEDAAARLRRRHFAALREAIAEAGGQEVKSLGDGLMVVFESAADAVDCARAMQRSTEADGDGIALRVGLHAGEPAHEEDDYFGTPVVVARRLCDRAEGGQILASDLVHGLLGPRAAGMFRPLGATRLKGLAEPVAAWEVSWSAATAPAAAAPGAPSLLAPLPDALARAETAFVGREAALARLGAALEAAGDRLGLAAVGGEPGIGKTRLAGEFARRAHADGAVVLFGRCDEEALVPYQPWAEALRGYLAAVPAAAPLAAGLERLTGAAPQASEQQVDPSLERLELFDAVGRFLSAVGRAGPVVLVLDDVHWADAPTLSLLRHLARRPAAVPGLILGTYRESELSRTHPLAAVLAELRRERAIERVSLAGLGEADVSGLLERTGGHAPPRGFVRALHEETEGNPFFIEEIVRHLIESGAIVQRGGRWTSDRTIEDMGIPEGVREAVGRRLARLSDATNRALADASVLGRRFEFDTLGAMSGGDDEELLDGLDEAVAAQLVLEASEGGRPAYAFRHALVRETLYGELSLPRRQRGHLRAADAIEKVHGRRIEPHAASMALHLRQAGAAADPRRALEWTLRAAAGHAAALAWEEAAVQLEAALELMEDADAAPEERARVLERLADLHYVTNADLESGAACLEEALACYRAAGLDDRAARIHSRLARDLCTFWGPTMDIRRAVEHMAAAEAVLGRDAATAPVALLNLAAATVAVSAMDVTGIRDAAQRAQSIGRTIDRPLVVLNAEVLDAWGAAAQGDPRAEQRLDAAWEDADRRNHPWLAFLATWMLVPIVFWQHGAAELARRLDRELARPRLAGAPGQRRLLHNFRSQHETLAGRLEAARAIVGESPLPAFPLSEHLLSLYAEGPDRAHEHADELLERGRRVGDRWSASMGALRHAHAAAAAGDLVTATRSGRSALQEFEAGGYVGFAAYERGPLTLRMVRTGDVGAAREQLAAGRSVVLDDRWGVGHTWLLAAEGAVAAASGDATGAEPLLGRAVEDLERREQVYDVAEVRRAWGVLTGRPEHVDAALGVYRDTGAAASWVELALADRELAAAGAPAR